MRTLTSPRLTWHDVPTGRLGTVLGVGPYRGIGAYLQSIDYLQ